MSTKSSTPNPTPISGLTQETSSLSPDSSLSTSGGHASVLSAYGLENLTRLPGQPSFSAVASPATNFRREGCVDQRSIQTAIAEAIDNVVIPAAEKAAGRELSVSDYDLMGKARVSELPDGRCVTEFFWNSKPIATIIAGTNGIVTAESHV